MDSHSGIKNELTLMVVKSCFATLGLANSFGIRVGALTSKGRSVCYFGSTGDGCCTWLFHIKQKHGIHQHVFLFPTQRNQLSPDVRWIRDNGLSRMICTPFTGQLVKGDFLCAIPMNSKNIALTCIGKDNIRKHLKAFPKGVFA